MCPELIAPYRPALTPPTLSPAALTTPSCCLHLHQSGQSCWAGSRGVSTLSSVNGMLAKATKRLHHPQRVVIPQDQPLGTRKVNTFICPSHR